jgi:hypothetical protein
MADRPIREGEKKKSLTAGMGWKDRLGLLSAGLQDMGSAFQGNALGAVSGWAKQRRQDLGAEEAAPIGMAPLSFTPMAADLGMGTGRLNELLRPVGIGSSLVGVSPFLGGSPDRSPRLEQFLLARRLGNNL